MASSRSRMTRGPSHFEAADAEGTYYVKIQRALLCYQTEYYNSFNVSADKPLRLPRGLLKLDRQTDYLR